MKKLTVFKTLFAAALATVALCALVACGSNTQSTTTSGETESVTPESITIAVPSDATNEARALLLLQDQGLITLKDGAGLTATPRDIEENPNNIEFLEVEAAAIPSTLQDVDYAVINGNYAIGANLDTSETLAAEDADSDAAEVYANVVAVRAGDENTPKTKALVSALSTESVKDFIDSTYEGSVVTVYSPQDPSTIPAPEDDDTTITVGASPAPHAEILSQVKDLLAEHGWNLEIVEFSDYILPNQALENGELDANYFQHITYLLDYNAENGTDLVSAGAIHFEPLGLYPGRSASITELETVK